MSANRIVVDLAALSFICPLNECVSHVLITSEALSFVVPLSYPQELKAKAQLLLYVIDGN